MRHLTREAALLEGLLVDVSDHAAEMGFDASIFASAAVMQAHGVAGIRAIVVLICQVPELADTDPEPVLVQLRARRGGSHVALDVLREPFGDGHAITVTLADDSR
jgi:hypothetical protein